MLVYDVTIWLDLVFAVLAQIPRWTRLSAAPLNRWSALPQPMRAGLSQAHLGTVFIRRLHQVQGQGRARCPVDGVSACVSAEREEKEFFSSHTFSSTSADMISGQSRRDVPPMLTGLI